MQFEALDRTVKELFLDGQVNPGLIDAAVSAPDYFTYSFRSDEPVGTGVARSEQIFAGDQGGLRRLVRPSSSHRIHTEYIRASET